MLRTSAAKPISPPSASELLRDFSTSFWLRNALKDALGRDPVDAANDAAVLCDVLDSRCKELLRHHQPGTKIYFAGPDVFRPDLSAWRIEVMRACESLGVIPLLPCDNEVVSSAAIVESNLRMLREADAVLANLNAFRGVEPDSGTIFETAVAFTTGIPVLGYVSDFETVSDRVTRIQGRHPTDIDRDCDGYAIEDFGRCVNIMLAESIPIIVADTQNALRELVRILQDASPVKRQSSI